MKIDNKRDDTVFISHNGLTLFFNQKRNSQTNEIFYVLNVHKNVETVENKKWEKVADMTLSKDNLTELNSKLAILNS